MTSGSRPARSLSPLVPAGLALLIAAWVFGAHTFFALRYFRPTLDDALAAFLPWGPGLAAEWVPHLGRLAGAAAFFLSLPGLGALLLGAAGRRAGARPFEIFVQAGAALAAWSTLGILMAAAGLCGPLPLRAGSAALALAGLAAARRAAWPDRAALRALAGDGRVIAAAGFAFLYLLTTIVPETFYDALVYHLAVPQAWLRAGRWVDLPDLHLTRLPGLLQTVFLWALAWSDERLCKLAAWGAGLLLAGAVGVWTGERWGRAAGAWAALLFVSSPMIGVNLWSCANDLAAGFFFLLAFALWHEAWENDGSAEFDRGRLFLAGLMFGAAMASKYTAVFGAFYFPLDLLARRRSRPGGRTIPAGAPGLIFAAAAALPLLPWWFRTGLFTGNPFFPQATGLFGGDLPENLALLKVWNADARGHDELPMRLLSLLRESFRGVEEGRFGFVGPALLMPLLLLPFVRYGAPARQLLGAAAVSYIFYAGMTGRLRYFIPQIGLLFALGAGALADFSETLAASRRGAAVARAMKVLLGAAVLLNALWLTLIFQRFNQGWDVAWGRKSPAAYLKEEHIGVYGHPSGGAWQHLRERNADGRILLLGDARTYGAPLPAVASGAFNAPTYARWLADDPRPGALLARMRAEGIRWIVLNTPELRRVTPEAYRGPEYMAALGRLLDGLPPPVYRDAWTILFEVPPAEAAS